jgi:hypothetical protein
MKKNTLIQIALIFTLTLFFSCSKEAGDGGNSSIFGKVYAKDYNDAFTLLLGEYYEANQDVYIIYGDDKTYSDKTVTNPDGLYEFKYLRPGKYTVYTYSKDSTLQTVSNRIGVLQTVEITEKKQDVEVPNLVIFK